jgi:3-hydroxyisobutyrate dehydrogenase-like beta-hydroxyacid dehydrogenase
MSQNIGFIGMGMMGIPMSHNIAKAGYKVTVFNRKEERYKEVDTKLVSIAPSLKHLVASCDPIITMVTGPDALEDIFTSLGNNIGLMADKTLIDMSTISPSSSLRLKDNLNNFGTKFVDAPVSGSRPQAEAAQLVIMASGYPETFDEVTPILNTMGKKVVYFGEVPKSSIMKLAVNMLLGIMMEGFAESYNFAQRGGIDLETYLEVILNGALACPLFQGKSAKIKNEDFSQQFAMKHIAKDLKFAVDNAYETGAYAPSAALSQQLYRRAADLGLANEDLSAIIKIIRNDK